MLDPAQIIEKAKHSAFYLWLLNRSLDRMVPFNKPHGFRITKIEDDRLQTRIPFVRKNFNHIRGLHACALATLSEFTTGFFLVSRLDGRKYRLIMQRIEVVYHYQGKRDAVGEFSASSAWLKQEIYDPLQIQEAVVVPCEIKLYDVQGNHLTTGQVHWQVKRWDKVKTRV